jgi:hypothetical protein
MEIWRNIKISSKVVIREGFQDCVLQLLEVWFFPQVYVDTFWALVSDHYDRRHYFPFDSIPSFQFLHQHSLGHLLKTLVDDYQQIILPLRFYILLQIVYFILDLVVQPDPFQVVLEKPQGRRPICDQQHNIINLVNYFPQRGKYPCRGFLLLLQLLYVQGPLINFCVLKRRDKHSLLLELILFGRSLDAFHVVGFYVEVILDLGFSDVFLEFIAASVSDGFGEGE